MSEQHTLFYIYAHEDELLRDELEKHLSLLKHQGVITTWYDRRIAPGTDWSQEINQQLNTASLILLLISSSFLASNYCYQVEMQRAMQLHNAGVARVIPIILRPVDWQTAPFSILQSLPRDGKPVTTWENLDAAFHDITKGIRQAIELQDRSSTRQEAPLVYRQNRERLLKRVRSIWIEGIFENSVHHDALIELRFQERPDALANPWRLAAQESNLPPRLLHPGTHIMTVYDKAEGELLILGEPGSGKTTLLLEITQALLNRAEQDNTYLLPVVFHLSSWAEKRGPLTNWLAEELSTKYQVPRPLSREWIIKGRILPLLDGFDEVKEEARLACLEALDIYHQEYTMIPLVICSRTKEYFATKQHLRLQRAVVIQPLTQQQIEDYLLSIGEQLTSLRVALREDEDLQKLVQTPLMLSILILAYQGQAKDALLLSGTQEERRHQVFTFYVQQMLIRRGVETHYTPEQTIHYLIWLARQMRERSQSEFYLERMQPTWLPNKPLLLGYRVTIFLVLGLMTAPMIGGFNGVLYGFPSGLRSTFLTLLFFGLLSVLFAKYADSPKLLHLYTRPIAVPIDAAPPKTLDGIYPREILTWSWKKARRAASIGLRRGLITGLCLGLVLDLIAWFGSRIGATHVDLFRVVIIGLLVVGVCTLIFGLVLALTLPLVGGWSNKELDTYTRLIPNMGIQRSGQYALRSLVITGLIVGSFLGLAMYLNVGLLGGIVSGLYFGLFFGASIGLGFGGEAYLRHYCLRLLLWHAKLIPWDYLHFLDYATERILLRRVGGSYIFIHSLLLDYFASLETPFFITRGSSSNGPKNGSDAKLVVTSSALIRK